MIVPLSVLWLACPLAQADLAQDLEALERILESRYSYLTLRRDEWKASFREAKARLGKEVDRRELALQVTRLLAAFRDGHTRLLEEPFAPGALPFLVGEAEGRWVAFREDRAGFVDDGHPFLEGLDGVPIDRWLEAAGRWTPLATQRVRVLRHLGHLRADLGLPAEGRVRAELSSAAGSRKIVELPLSPRKPVYGTWPRGSHRRIGEVGYLRIDRMDEDPRFLKGVAGAFDGFQETSGLVIDVRGNGGGSRAVLEWLFPRLMSRSDAPRLINVAAYRLGPGEDAGRTEGYLRDRRLYPLSADVWSAPDRAAIEGAGFRPEWTLPEGAFSAWHYGVIRPRDDVRTYDRPVVVLQDGDCYSATDIFLGALKGWRRVTLMGTTSAGGSGRPRAFELPRSGLRVQVSSIASFRPDGKLYDGRGVEPDIEVRPRATDLVGRTDSVLEAALRRLGGTR